VANRIKWSIAATSVIILILIFWFTVGLVTNKTPLITIPSGAQKAVSEIIPNYEKKLGVLPDSGSYKLKIWRENVVASFKSGNAKNEFLLISAKKRLLETYLMGQKSDLESAQKATTNYKNIIGKLEKRDLKDNITSLNQTAALLNGLKTDTATSKILKNEIFNEAYQKTQSLVDKYNPKPENLVVKEKVTGKVKSKDENNFKIDYEGGEILVSNANSALYVDKSGKPTSQSFSDINIGLTVTIKVLGQEVVLPSNGTYGMLSAEQIVIGGENVQ
jgi:hypothetical protein